jgi:hypothetical protein
MLLVLKDAKEKFGFRLANFCIMPAHIHLLIIPGKGGNLSHIMHWVKTIRPSAGTGYTAPRIICGGRGILPGLLKTQGSISL